MRCVGDDLERIGGVTARVVAAVGLVAWWR
jgi:hypothetical protein